MAASRLTTPAVLALRTLEAAKCGRVTEEMAGFDVPG